MTQLDYDRIAETLNRVMHRALTTGEAGIGEAMKELANEFDSTDVRFDVTRFLNTCLKQRLLRSDDKR